MTKLISSFIFCADDGGVYFKFAENETAAVTAPKDTLIYVYQAHDSSDITVPGNQKVKDGKVVAFDQFKGKNRMNACL